MTLKEMEHKIEDGAIEESKLEKAKLQIAAAKALSKDMKEKLKGLALNKKLREFLNSKQFVDTIYQVITHTSHANIQSQKRLRTKELKPLKNRKCSIEEQLVICEKLKDGIRDLLTTSQELDYDTILFQGLFVSYVDTLNANLSV